MKKIKYSAILLMAVVIMTSCDANKVYEEYQSVASSEWSIEDQKVFEFEIKEEQAAYNMYFNLRNGADYPYSNLYVFLESERPDGITEMDTLQFILADKQGRWLGNGLGDINEMQILFAFNKKFPAKGKYSFTFTHGMRTEKLNGIHDLGLRVEKAQ